MRAAPFYLLIFYAVAIFTSAEQSPALAAGKSVALIIGNSAYQNTAPLRNPKNDAEDVSAQLRSMGFDVILGVDLDKTGMDRKIGEFMSALAGASVGVFFYGGHGLQVGGENYLVPVDAKLLSQRSLDFEMIRLDLVQRAMERNTQTNIIFLDACRDNPLARNLARALGTRSAELPRGLAAVKSGIGTLISFSTQPGAVALDGEGRNSPFATALTKHLAADESITDVLINVRNDVVAATNQSQIPWEHSALRANFYFKGAKPSAAPPQTAIPPAAAKPSYDQEAELELWTAIAESRNPALFQSFAEQFPNGRFAVTARLMADSLKKGQEQSKADSEAEAARREADQASEEAQKALEAMADAERRRAEASAAAEEARKAAQAEREKQTAAASSTSSPLVVAALPDPAPSDGKAAMALEIQKELKRVGCYSGEIDGKWGDGTRSALSDFAARTKISLSTDEPTQSALDTLSASKEGFCPEGDKRKSTASDDQSSGRSKRQQRTSGSGSKKGRDCAPMNGPYGTYENLWCK